MFYHLSAVRTFLVSAPLTITTSLPSHLPRPHISYFQTPPQTSPLKFCYRHFDISFAIAPRKAIPSITSSFHGTDLSVIITHVSHSTIFPASHVHPSRLFPCDKWPIRCRCQTRFNFEVHVNVVGGESLLGVNLDNSVVG